MESETDKTEGVRNSDTNGQDRHQPGGMLPPRPLPRVLLRMENGSVYAVGIDTNLKAGED